MSTYVDDTLQIVYDAIMPAKQARFDDALVSWYENAAKNENAIRRKKGLKPLAWVELLRVVAERFAGLPASHDVDLDAVKRRAKRAAKKAATTTNAPTTSDRWTPPHGGKTAAKKAATTSDMWTPPHGGKTAAKRTSKKAPPNMTTPPHGGKTAAKKAPAKRAQKSTAKDTPTVSDMWTRPHGG